MVHSLLPCRPSSPAERVVGVSVEAHLVFRTSVLCGFQAFSREITGFLLMPLRRRCVAERNKKSALTTGPEKTPNGTIGHGIPIDFLWTRRKGPAALTPEVLLRCFVASSGF